MAHAHPVPDGLYLSAIYSQEPRRASNIALTITSSSVHTPQSQRQTSPLSPQNRRLQLRSSGFRGPALPACRMSPFFGSTALGSDLSTCPVNDENSTSRATEKKSLFGEDLPPNTTSILQEISNSTRRTRETPKQGIIGIFEDSTATSWLQESSKNPSPSSRSATPAEMKRLREITANERVSTPSSPLVRSAKARRTTRVLHRSPSSESTKYIEHLESELASLHSKLDALTSPTSTKAQAAKLRGLNTQVRILRQEIAQWESNYEERVADAVYQQSEINTGMKSKVRKLEEEVQAKDSKIKELEWELESAQVKLRDADSLESTNQNLEHRVDVLTGLLAQSPTRLEPRSAFTSPTRMSSAQRTPRPKSMLIRMPSSPAVARGSSNSAMDPPTWPMSPTKIPADHLLSPLSQRQAWPDDLSSIGAMLSDPTASISDASAYHSSAQSTSSSRPTSMISTSSSTSWGPPWTVSFCDEQRSGRRHSRMRRFPSNNVSLKPLILPTAVALPSVPSSAPAGGSYHTPYRDTSNESVHPTITFLSRSDDAPSPFTTPKPPNRSRSASAVSLNGLKRRDGKPDLKIDTGKSRTPSIAESSVHTEAANEEDRSDKSGSLRSYNRKRKSLQLELEEARESLREASQSPPPTPPTAADEQPQSGDHEPNFERLDLDTESPASGEKHVKRRRRHSNPKTPESRSALLSPQTMPKKPANTTPISILTQPTDLFTRLATFITSLKQDPLQLARRILINAWRCQTSRLSGMGWWLLGLLFNSRIWNKREAAADVATGEEETNRSSRSSRKGSRDRKFDWQFYSAEASRERIVGQHATGFSNSECSNDTTLSNLGPTSSAAIKLHNWTHLPCASGRNKCKDCVEPPSRRSLRLWLRFSLAMILAIGIAIKDGPSTLLVDVGPSPLRGLFTPSPSPRPWSQRKCTCECGLDGCLDSEVGSSRSTPRQRENGTKKKSGRTAERWVRNRDVDVLEPSPNQSPAKSPEMDEGDWGWDLTFTDPLGPEDFEKEGGR
ncbi:MAG: hypothetical protein MMC33_009578 [Icmadophila ericetorum]|nr:hypothetical protein [Icmadophila ericetorum]